MRIYAAYMPHICRIFRQNVAYFTAFLAGELPAYFPKKSRYKPVSLLNDLRSHFMLNSVFLVGFTFFLPHIWRQQCENELKILPHCQQQKCSSETDVSGNITFMQIFATVLT